MPVDISMTSYCLGDIVSLSQGLAINVKTKHLLVDDGLPLLRITDLINSAYSQYVNPIEVPTKCIAAKDDIIYTRTGQVGLVFRGVSGVVHNNCFKVIPNHDLIDSNYLYWFLSQNYIKEHANNIAAGSVQKDLNHSAFKSIQIDLPPLDVQKKIASILDSISNKIDLNRQMNETLEDMARAIFKSWFVDFDPVRAKAEGRDTGLPKEVADLFPDSFEETELGEVPKGWRIGTLENYAYLNPETWSKDGAPQYIKYVDLANTKWGTIDSISTYLWKEAPSRAQRILRSGDTIIGTVRPGNGSYSIISENGLTGSTGFAVLRPKKEVFVQVVYLAATSMDNIESLAHLADGGAYPAIRPDVVLATPVVYANIFVLEHFAKITKAIVDKIEENKRESRTLAELRDTLLPKLISGELRIKDAEQIIGDMPDE
jgi:type I restriction enzyme S subunit